MDYIQPQADIACTDLERYLFDLNGYLVIPGASSITMTWRASRPRCKASRWPEIDTRPRTRLWLVAERTWAHVN